MRLLVAILFVLIAQKMVGQSYYILPHHWNYYDRIAKTTYSSAGAIRPEIQPYNYHDVNDILTNDSIIQPRSFFKTRVAKEYWKVTVRPIASLTFGSITAGSAFQAGMGAQLNLIGENKWAAQVNLAGHQLQPIRQELSPFSSFVTRFNETFVHEGYGLLRRSGNAYSVFDATGFVSFKPNKYVDFQLGRGNNFIGHGINSLLLGDRQAPYQYLRTNVNVWRFKYSILYTDLDHIEQQSDLSSFKIRSKFSTIHYLSTQITDWLSFGVFESVIWSGGDTLVQRGFDPHYLNPIIFFRPVEFNTGSADNVLVGGQLAATIARRVVLFGQVILDEFLLDQVRSGDGWWANKQGFQLGGRYFDVLGIKNLNGVAELNWVRPFTYSHNRSQQNYGHLGQPMAHPLGANFQEVSGNLHYFLGKWDVNADVTYAEYGADDSTEIHGQDIFISPSFKSRDFGFETTGGSLVKIAQAQFSGGYVIMPSTNLRISAGVRLTVASNEGQRSEQTYLWLGIRSDFRNGLRN